MMMMNNQGTDHVLGTEIQNCMQKWRNELEGFIELQYGLLTKLTALKVLTRREYEELVSCLKCTSSYRQCADLLNVMQHKSAALCEKFIDALNASDQKHVANFIKCDARRFETGHPEFYCWPLDEVYTNRIMERQDTMVDLIDLKCGLIAILWGVRCINDRQKESLEAKDTPYERNMLLLTILQRRSIRDYHIFVGCLQKSGMAHLVDLFYEDDAFVVPIRCENGNLDEDNLLVDGMKRLLLSMDPYARKQKLEEIIRAVLHHEDIILLDVKPSQSVLCYFMCCSEAAVQHLYDIIDNGRLTAAMQAIFDQLVDGKDIVHVLNASEMKKQRIELKGKLGCNRDHHENIGKGELETFRRIINDHPFFNNASMRGFTVFEDQLDVMLGARELVWSMYDVLEPILLQVAVVLFKRNQLRLLLPRPDLTTLITISSVCRDWFEVITGRRILRKQLKRTFKKLTVLPTELTKAAVIFRHYLIDIPLRPHDADKIVSITLASVCRRWWNAVRGARQLKRLFKYDPQLRATLLQPPINNDGFPHQVIGVTLLMRHLYVIYEDYDVIEEYICSNVFNKIDHIKVKGLKAPHDMVGCNETQALFINDWASDRAAMTIIWRVDIQTGESDVFVEVDNIARLSLVENRLLMTSRDSLSIHDVRSCECIKKVELLENMEGHTLWHAIESNRDTFFVIHGPLGNSSVSEIDSQGRVLRVFDDGDQFYNCGYLALDSVGRLLVTDKKSDMVILLDEHLKFNRILFDKKRLENERPWRLNYDNNSNILAVGLGNGQVKIFECSPSYLWGSDHSARMFFPRPALNWFRETMNAVINSEIEETPQFSQRTGGGTRLEDLKLFELLDDIAISYGTLEKYLCRKISAELRQTAGIRKLYETSDNDNVKLSKSKSVNTLDDLGLKQEIYQNRYNIVSSPENIIYSNVNLNKSKSQDELTDPEFLTLFDDLGLKLEIYQNRNYIISTPEKILFSDVMLNKSKSEDNMTDSELFDLLDDLGITLEQLKNYRNRYKIVSTSEKTSFSIDMKLKDSEIVSIQDPAQITEEKLIEQLIEATDVHGEIELLTTLNEPPKDSKDEARRVTGVTQLNEELFVVYEDHDKIERFLCSPPFEKREPIEIENMKPFDIVASDVPSQLFIVDWSNRVIWRVSASTGSSDRFIEIVGNRRAKTSLVDNCLLVPLDDLLVFHNIFTGEKMKNIQLPKDVKLPVWHAVESNRGSFWVLHGVSSTVSEIGAEGNMVRTVINGMGRSFCVVHLALDSIGRVIMADSVVGRVFIINVDRDGKDNRFLDKEILGKELPVTLDYSKKSNRLVVGFWNGHVKIFQNN